jgi:hypothetical protein
MHTKQLRMDTPKIQEKILPAENLMQLYQGLFLSARSRVIQVATSIYKFDWVQCIPKGTKIVLIILNQKIMNCIEVWSSSFCGIFLLA